MINPKVLEDAYREFTKNLAQWVPDGIVQVDLKLLNDLGILNHNALENGLTDDQINHHFHIVETPEKVTLFNEQFAVWIVPELIEDIPRTTTLIALLQSNQPHLEIVYMTMGVYNSPKYILKILQHYIAEVQDTEAVISAIGKKKT